MAKHIVNSFTVTSAVAWQHSDGDPPTRASNARGMTKSRFSTNISTYLRNGTKYRQFQWNTNTTPYLSVLFRLTLSDLAKCSMTQSVPRSLCDSWASCFSLLPTSQLW